MKIRFDEDGILFDAQLEWEHEEGKQDTIISIHPRRYLNIIIVIFIDKPL